MTKCGSHMIIPNTCLFQPLAVNKYTCASIVSHLFIWWWRQKIEHHICQHDWLHNGSLSEPKDFTSCFVFSFITTGCTVREKPETKKKYWNRHGVLDCCNLFLFLPIFLTISASFICSLPRFPSSVYWCANSPFHTRFSPLVPTIIIF